MNEQEQPISKFLNSKYKEYCLYTINERAIPSLIDGLKPVQRFIFYSALDYCKNSPVKTLSLLGKVTQNGYCHGDSSLEGAINNLTSDYTGSNNIPMLNGIGNFGNRLVRTASAARYTKVKLNNQFEKLFRDFNIIEKNSDPEIPIPIYYLPIVPFCLVLGATGIAVGHATEILPRSIDLLMDVVNQKLNNPDLKFNYSYYKPYYKGYKGKILFKDTKWFIYGRYTINNKKLIIDEIPIDFDRESYITLLNKLEDSGIVKNYIDKSKDNFLFEINLEKCLTENEILKLFKLEKALNENITVLDENQKLKIYKNPDDLIDDFIRFRLKKYNERISVNLKRAKNSVRLFQEKLKFNLMVNSKEINLLEMSKDELLNFLKDRKFIYGSEIIKESIYKLTKDEIQILRDKLKKLEEYIDYYSETSNVKEFLKDLVEK